MEFKVETSELRKKADGETVKELADFLEEKTGAKVNVISDGILISFDEETHKIPSKTHMRVLLRKFLHQTDLKEDFRVIKAEENVFVMKERKRVKMEE